MESVQEPTTERSTRIQAPHDHAILRRKAVRGGMILLVSRLLIQLFAWSVTLIVARFLQPYDYGLMTTGILFIGLPDLLAEAGMGRALIHKQKLEPADLAECFTVNLLLSACLYALLFLIAGPAAGFMDAPELTLFLRVLGLTILLTPFHSVPQALLDRDLHMGWQSAINIVCALTQAALVLGLAVAGFGYWRWPLAFSALVSWRRSGSSIAPVGGHASFFPVGGAAQLLAFGIHVSLANLLWFVYINSDYAAVGKLAGPVALGFYALAYQLVTLPVQKLTANLNQVAFPVFCRLRDDPDKLRSWYLRLTTLLSFFGLPVLVGAALVADDAFTVVLGEKWLPSVLLFRLLSATGAVMIVGSTITHLFNAVGRPDLSLKYTAACAVLFPSAFFVLGHFYGVVGVCIGWLLYPVIVALAFRLTRHLTGVGLGALLRAQAPVAGAVLFMSLAVLAARWLLHDFEPIAVRLCIQVSVGVPAYAGIVLAFARRTVVADVLALRRELKG